MSTSIEKLRVAISEAMDWMRDQCAYPCGIDSNTSGLYPAPDCRCWEHRCAATALIDEAAGAARGIRVAALREAEKTARDRIGKTPRNDYDSGYNAAAEAIADEIDCLAMLSAASSRQEGA